MANNYMHLSTVHALLLYSSALLAYHNCDLGSNTKLSNMVHTKTMY